jgi:hypothetical protein
MALFTVFGPEGPYFVPLVMAYAALIFVYFIGRGSYDHLTGLVATTLVAVDPVFAVYASQPLSDVPATCWLLAAVLIALPGESRLSISRGGGAGLCAGMAVLTRPVLLPAAAVLVMAAAIKCSSRSRYALIGTVLIIVALQLALNVYLYGGVTLSGYGTTSNLFELSLSRLAANISNFGKWLTYSHTPLIWMAWPLALVVLRRDRWAWTVSAVAAAAAAPFLFYFVFDNWDSSRFVLPSIVLVLVLSGRAAAVVTSQRMTRLLRAVVLVALCAGCAIASHRSLQREGVALAQTLEAKYPLVGEWFRTNTSERAVVLASLHSGTIRLYGGRQTIRWDHIPENALASTIDRLVEAGYEPYLALDLPNEPVQFEARFRGQSIPLDPIARVRVVNIYRFVSAR